MFWKAKQLLKSVLDKTIRPILVKGKPKVFCIGRNKTGTTSLSRAFKDLGYIVGYQRKAELLLDDIIAGDYTGLIEYCKTAQVFQDVPFSYPETYKVLDEAFPESKFILSVRNDAEQWYRSLNKFHTNAFGNGNSPTAEDLKAAEYVHKGWMWKANRFLYNSPVEDPYHKETLIKHYKDHNKDIKNYFKGRPGDLLIINVAKKSSYHKLCNFLEVKPLYNSFPWKNKTNSNK